MKLFFLLFIGCLIVAFHAHAQVKDSLPDSLQVLPYKNLYKDLLEQNVFLNAKGNPEGMMFIKKKSASSATFFYFVAFLLFLLGLFRYVYNRYFTTLFQVFFNTSLRQTQLTDQLEQAAIPSFLFNIFSFVLGGLYIYLLHQYFTNKTNELIDWYLIGICIAALTLVYLVKYFSILFIGWVTGYKTEASTYIFVVFLLNKVIAILLLPCIIMLAFSSRSIAGYALNISLILVFVLILVRFFRAYGLLQNRLNLNTINFLIYIIALEILPILLIYKAVLKFFQ